MRRAALWRNRLVLAGSSLVLLLVLSAWLAPFGVKAKWLRNPIQQMSAGLDADGMPLPPGRQFLAGTDNFGRDVLSRVLHGTRV